MNEEKKKELIAKHEEYVRIAVYNVLFTNDLVREYASFAMMKLKDTPLDRHLVKYHRKRLQKLIDKYAKNLFKRAGEQALRMEMYNDKFSAEVDEHMEKFYLNVKNSFDKAGAAYSDVLAFCEVARTLANYSVLQLNKRVQELGEIDPLFNSMDMSHLSMLNEARALDCLMGAFIIKGVVHVDSDECLAAFQSLKKALMDVSIINKSINAE